MEKIIATRGLTGIAYKKYRNDKLVQSVNIDSFIKRLDDFTYFLLTNSYGQLIKDSYKYLNVNLINASYKKRELTLTALKLLYTYIELSLLRGPEEIDHTRISKFDEFLEGGSRKGTESEFICSISRSNSTINKYYSVYREYYNFLEIQDNIFEELKGIRYIKNQNKGFLAHTISSKLSTYSVTKKESIFQQVPKFISLVEYRKILEYIRANYSLREEIIVILMYEYGMRLGEVLGLTLEDIYGTNYTKGDYGQLILRNRFTDKRYQNAKGCMKITSKNIYNKPEYSVIGLGKKFGCESIKVSVDTLSKIETYIKLTRSYQYFGAQAFKNLRAHNFADKVTDRKDIKQNSYVFLSKNGTPLCSKAWDNIVKKIYQSNNLDIDTGKKENGLSHRFRHGFAMFKVLIEKYERLELSKVMRHTNIRSCECYFTLTDSQKSELVKAAFDLQLKRGMDIEDIFN